MVEGKLSEDRFQKLSSNYETEQCELEKKATMLEKIIHDTEQTTLNTTAFLKQVREHTTINKLTPEIIRMFVDKIIVEKPEKIEGTRTKKQTIWIYWNYIGILDIEKTA
ncbi:DUF4368 domain-containing protein [Clostridium perfringens]